MSVKKVAGESIRESRAYPRGSETFGTALAHSSRQVPEHSTKRSDDGGGTRLSIAPGSALRIAICAALILLPDLSLAAGPLNLLDPTPRQVEVAFEVSPREVPAQTRAYFSRAYSASFEPGLRPSEARVVIPAATVEAHLLGDQKPIPNTFSDFVWTFDTETGHVVSAHLRGRVTPELDWGFVTSHTEADIEVEMGTARVGGFKKPRRILGQLVFSYCTRPEDDGCQLVETTPFDRSTGYVNAVGKVVVQTSILDLRNFSPMGEAIFREIEPKGDEFLADREFSADSSKRTVSGMLPGVSAGAPIEMPRTH